MFEAFNYIHFMLEEETFKKRLRIYDQYQSEKILFKYGDYVFLKDKSIMKNKKIVGNFDHLDEIGRSYKTIIFGRNKIFSRAMDISDNYDLFCYLLESKAGINLDEIDYCDDS